MSFFLLAFSLCFAGCDRQLQILPGTVAVINGRDISLRELEAQRIMLFADTGEGDLEEEVLRKQYTDALRQILVQEIVRTHMRKQGITLPTGAVEKQEELIRSDYPVGAFEEMLVEMNLSLDIWRSMLERRLLVEHFVNKELRSEVSIPAGEVEEYYKAHAAEFITAEQWHYVEITGVAKTDVEQVRNTFSSVEDALASQKQLGATLREIRMGKDRLPEDVRKELALLEPGKGSPVKNEGGSFRAFILLERLPPTEFTPAEVYKRVEQVLAEKKLQGLFTSWIQKQIKKTDMTLAGPLAASLMQNVQTEVK